MATQKFEFTGTAREWFGIAIVNLLLSLLTLGIYSAWAKVRRKKYFANNTVVAGRTFDYHARGLSIFIGRLIVAVAFVVFNLILTSSPIIAFVIFVIFMFFFPWLILNSLMFNARMTSFSNIRFSFVGKYGRSFLIFGLYPVLVLLTLFTTFPMYDRALKHFIANNHYLGNAKFSFNARIRDFYGAFLMMFAWVVPVLILVIYVSYLNGAFEFESLTDNPESIIALIILYGGIAIAILPAQFIYQALVRNVTYNAISIGEDFQLGSNVRPSRVVWIALSNTIITLCTLFLMLPWAQVRMAKYLADHTTLKGEASLDDFENQNYDAGNAISDAYTDLEGIDIGIGL